MCEVPAAKGGAYLLTNGAMVMAGVCMQLRVGPRVEFMWRHDQVVIRDERGGAVITSGGAVIALALRDALGACCFQR